MTGEHNSIFQVVQLAYGSSEHRDSPRSPMKYHGSFGFKCLRPIPTKEVMCIPKYVRPSKRGCSEFDRGPENRKTLFNIRGRSNSIISWTRDLSVHQSAHTGYYAGNCAKYVQKKDDENLYDSFIHPSIHSSESGNSQTNFELKHICPCVQYLISYTNLNMYILMCCVRACIVSPCVGFRLTSYDIISIMVQKGHKINPKDNRKLGIIFRTVSENRKTSRCRKTPIRLGEICVPCALQMDVFTRGS